MMPAIILTILIASLLLLSAVFSGSETGFYSLSRLKLRIQLQRGSLGDKTLAKLLHDSQGLIYSVLIGNNLVNYLLTAVITYTIFRITGCSAAANRYTTLLFGPMIFIFCEVLPKTIFYLNADSLSRKVAPFIWLFYSVCRWSGVIKVLKSLSVLFGRIFGIRSFSADPGYSLQRMQITDILQDTKDEGYFSHHLSRMFKMAVQLFETEISSMMIPISKCVCIPVSAKRDHIMHLLKVSPYTRLPVYRDNRHNIIGYVNTYRLLTDPEGVSVEKHIRKIQKLPPDTTATEAISMMRDNDTEIALISSAVSGREKHLGIITLTDIASLITKLH